MPSNQTPNYQLSQWEKSDKVLMEDFNADNAKIDAAIKAEADARSSQVAVLNAGLSKKGNCQIWTTTYVGTGGYGAATPVTVTFPSKPVLATIAGGGRVLPLITGYGMYSVTGDVVYGLGGYWDGNTVTFYASSNAQQALNEKGQIYTVVAFLAAD
ncbi:MAG: hypothetical protein HFF44_02770 [Lawsonibacter sp.]|nr:hypothetical protein [Lawsonibacter sp.]